MNESDSTEPTTDTSPGRSKVRRMAVAGAAVGVLGGAAVGLLATLPGSTSAATPETTVVADTTAPSDDSTRPTDAERLAKHTEMIRERLQGLVDDGTITAAQADAVAATLAEAGPGEGRRGPGGPGGKMGAMSDELAQVLGLADGAALRDELKAGKTLADIAEANGVPIQNVKDFLRTEAETRIAAAVEAGKLTQDEADAKLADLDAHIDAVIDGTKPLGGPGRHRGQPPVDGTTPANGDTGATDTSLDA